MGKSKEKTSWRPNVQGSSLPLYVYFSWAKWPLSVTNRDFYYGIWGGLHSHYHRGWTILISCSVTPLKPPSRPFSYHFPRSSRPSYEASRCLGKATYHVKQGVQGPSNASVSVSWVMKLSLWLHSALEEEKLQFPLAPFEGKLDKYNYPGSSPSWKQGLRKHGGYLWNFNCVSPVKLLI